MSAYLATGVPQYASMVWTREPFLLLSCKSDAAHKIRIKYLSKNTGLNAAGDTEQVALDSFDEIPNIDSQYHSLLVTLMSARICEDLMGLVDPEGKPLYPGLRVTAEVMRNRYERDLQVFKNRATQFKLDVVTKNYDFAGAELDWALRR